MWETSKPLLEDAKKEAEIMLLSGEVIRSIPFGEAIDSIFVTTNRELVVGTDYFEMAGKTFFVGCKP